MLNPGNSYYLSKELSKHNALKDKSPETGSFRILFEMH
jgi:hypothetical protein